MFPMEKEVQSFFDKRRKRRKTADESPVQQHGPLGMGQLGIQERSKETHQDASKRIDEDHLPREVVPPDSLQGSCHQVSPHRTQCTAQSHIEQQ